ncbi:MAG: MarR family winged helix-turn-helix transcriptional regulator [Candidatus Margulisiibacteriota bacterium]
MLKASRFGFLIWQLANLWKKDIGRALKKVELTFVQYVVLSTLSELDNPQTSITQKTLAEVAHCSDMVLSQVIRTLAQKKCVKIGTHPTDTRAKTVKLTPSGKRLVKDAAQIMDGFNQHFFAALEQEQGRMEQDLSLLWTKKLKKR